MMKSRSEQTSPTPAADDFSTLILVGKINSFVGWLLIVAVIIAALALADKSNGVSFASLLLIPFCLLIVASGQIISAFVSIARNSHDTANGLSQIRSILSNRETETSGENKTNALETGERMQTEAVMTPVEEYANQKGISIPDAIRSIKKGSLDGEKKSDGRWYVK